MQDTMDALFDFRSLWWNNNENSRGTLVLADPISGQYSLEDRHIWGWSIHTLPRIWNEPSITLIA